MKRLYLIHFDLYLIGRGVTWYLNFGFAYLFATKKWWIGRELLQSQLFFRCRRNRDAQIEFQISELKAQTKWFECWVGCHSWHRCLLSSIQMCNEKEKRYVKSHWLKIIASKIYNIFFLEVGAHAEQTLVEFFFLFRMWVSTYAMEKIMRICTSIVVENKIVEIQLRFCPIRVHSLLLENSARLSKKNESDSGEEILRV